jgi:hypothetical protein
MRKQTIDRLGIRILECTQRSTAEMFAHAASYRRPFASGGQGKGFQDAVILLSILDHLNTQPEWKGVLITNDAGFDGVEYQQFLPGFDGTRLRLSKLESIFDELFRPYFDETRVKPYRQLLAQADQLARNRSDELREYAARIITPEMFRPLPGDRVLQVDSLERLDVSSVDVPFPDTEDVLSDVRITINVMGTSKVRVVTDLAALRSLFGGLSLSTDPPTKEQEKQMSWRGVIEASGPVVDGVLREIRPESMTLEGM